QLKLGRRAMRMLVPVGGLALASCVSVAPSTPADTCQSAPAQAWIGRTASATTGRELLSATRTRELRWVAPGMIVTADYKFGRLTVSYDETMRIIAVNCG
ncbi:MAG: I78 family peptidase inhibitor, partial [Novosphingobium sp.]